MAIRQPTDFENMMLYGNYDLLGGYFSSRRRIRHLILPGPFVPIKIMFKTRIQLLRKPLVKAVN